MSADERLKRGEALQAADDLAGAAAEYEAVVATAPDHVQALGLLGTVRLRLGRAKEAAATFERLVAAAPALPEGHHFLGLALRALGRQEPAEAAFRKTLSLKPDHVGALSQLGMLLVERGDPDGAAAHLERAIALDPRAPEPRFWMAMVRERQGRADEAVERLEALTHQTPGFVPAHAHAGRLRASQGAHREAVRHYRHWTGLEPKRVAAHAELGLALIRLGEMEEARSVLDHALALNPDDPRAVACKATLLEQLGEAEAAWALLRPLLEGGTVEPDAVSVFAAVAPRVDRVDPALDLIERTLNGPSAEGLSGNASLAAGQREALHFAAGNLCDRMRDWDRAFAHFERANSARRLPFDRAAHAAHVDALIAAFSADALARLPRASNRYRLPLFIVGMPRSGTTLVEQILASHPRVFGAGERPEISGYTGRLPAMLNWVPYPGCVAEADRGVLDTLAEHYHETLRRLAPAADRVTDKMPGNFLHLGLIALLLPGCRVIHVQRDPRDTCLSCYFQSFAGHAYARDLSDLGFYYRQYERLMAHWREVQPVPMLEVRYEELVADQEAQSRRLVDFAGLEWDERCLRFHELERPVATASYAQVRRPMYTGSLERWRRYEAHLGPLVAALAGVGESS